MPDLVIPDVSEFQSVDFTVYSGPIIVRAHNGRRPDYHWDQHAAGASTQPWWAAYQYLPSNVGAALAAQRFLDTLGTFRPNVTILDLEEGDGDQQQRQHEWLTVMAGDPARDWTYSGDYFARAHGLTVDWIAAYQNRAPTTAHTLWQFTDAHDFPGIGSCDASVFLGTVNDLIALTTSSEDEFTMDAEARARFDAIDLELKDIRNQIGDSHDNVQTGLAGAVHKDRLVGKAHARKDGMTDAEITAAENG